jgi:hypothetical protein
VSFKNMALNGLCLTKRGGEGEDGCMAKKALKTQSNPVGYKVDRATGDIEYLFKLYREVHERVAKLEDEGVALGECLANEALDRMEEEERASRPWWAKVGVWLREEENALLVASIGCATVFLVAVIILVA